MLAMVIRIFLCRQYIGRRVSRPTRIQFYKARAKPTLSYGSESETVRVTDQRRLVSAEVLFMRTVGHNFSVLHK